MLVFLRIYEDIVYSYSYSKTKEVKYFGTYHYRRMHQLRRL